MNKITRLVTTDFGDILSGDSVEAAITIPDATEYSWAGIGWSYAGLPIGIIGDVRCSASGEMTVRLFNATGGTINVGEITYVIAIFVEEGVS